MIVTAALVWYDEPVQQLMDCVEGAARIADRLVAIDGPYQRYPHQTIQSPIEQHHALRAACDQHNIDLTIVTIDRPWKGQIEKRSHLLRWASHQSDWIAVIDADHIIHTDRDAARNELATVTHDVIEARFVTPENPDRDLHDSASGQWHAALAGKEIPVAHLFRALPGLHVVNRHWHYKAWKDGQEVWMYHDDQAGQLPRYQLATDYIVEHRCLHREPAEILANRAFCNDRDQLVALTGQEDHDPNVPIMHDYNDYSQ
jgi:glycosyltransferase involved in cell wall biosynthesis